MPFKNCSWKINATHHRLHLWFCSVTFVEWSSTRGLIIQWDSDIVASSYQPLFFSVVSCAAHVLVYLFTLFLKETFISEATWLKVTWRRPVAYTGQRSSCACQLGSAPRFCSLILPCYPLSFVFQMKLRTLEDVRLLSIITDGQYLTWFWSFAILSDNLKPDANVVP